MEVDDDALVMRTIATNGYVESTIKCENMREGGWSHS